MWQLLISALIAALKGKVGAALATFLTETVKTAADWDMPGAEKKAKVLEAADAVGGAVAEQLRSASGNLVNLLVEALVAKLGDR